MLLSELLKDIVTIPKEADKPVSGLTLDSRQVQPGSIFLATKGTHSDGRQYIDNAITNGAVAVLKEADQADQTISYQQSIPLIPVSNLKNQTALLAARFYSYPAKELRMIGVTGTNGKTSCTHFFAQVLQSQEIRCGIIGTLGSGFFNALGEAGLTTPDPINLQAMLKKFVEQKAIAVAMEVSSHSIDQGRVNAIDFDIGVFTNLTQDHLDYHGTMEKYAAVKRRFLADFPVKHRVINTEDALGNLWAQEIAAAGKSVYVYATNRDFLPEGLPAVYTDQVELSLHGIKAMVHSPWGAGEMKLSLIGHFNLNNALAVLTALCLYGIPFEQALAAMARVQPVPGRMQTIGGQAGKPLIVVDYAHTPDALEKVLQALRAHTEHKLICLFGCGGDRDPGKRPLMAAIAEQWADKVILTNDNPRHENPQAIADQIMQGFKHPDRVQIELDRSKAIQKSIQYAAEGDCVLIAGKGAERYQQIGDQRLPFDDMTEVNNYLGIAV